MCGDGDGFTQACQQGSRAIGQHAGHKEIVAQPGYVTHPVTPETGTVFDSWTKESKLPWVKTRQHA